MGYFKKRKGEGGEREVSVFSFARDPRTELGKQSGFFSFLFLLGMNEERAPSSASLLN